MSKYPVTHAQNLLEKEKNGISLADELQSAIAHAIDQFCEDPDLAVFALADDLLPGVLKAFAGLDFNRYEIESVEEKTAPEVAPSEAASEQFATGSITTAYLAKRSDNTRHTYDTWSGKSIPQDDHITIIIPIKAGQVMFADGPQLVELNPECVAAQSAAVRKVREEEKRKKRAELRRKIADRITEEEGFEEQLAHLETQMTVIYDQIDKKVDAKLEEMGKNS